MLDVPFAYSTNGDGFLENDRSDPTNTVERYIPIDCFPTPADLWARYCRARNITAEQQPIVAQDWFYGAEDKYIIADQEVLTVAETVVRYGASGQRVDVPVDEHVRGIVRALCPTRPEFRDLWRNPEQRADLLAKLETEGITAGDLAKT